MKLACGDYSFPLVDHELACDIVAGLGFCGIDLGLMGNRSHLRPETIKHDVAGWAGRIGERLAARGLDVADVFLIPWSDYQALSTNHPDASVRAEGRDLFSQMVDFATRVGAQGMTILPGMEYEGEARERSLALAAEELRARVEIAGAAGLHLSFEPHVGSIVPLPLDALALVESVPGIGVTLDHTHFVRQSRDEQEADVLYPHARHYHARCATPGRLQSRMSDNTIDFERVINQLSAVHYESWVAVEFVWTDWEDCNQCDNISETILLRDRLAAAIEGRQWQPHVATI